MFDFTKLCNEYEKLPAVKRGVMLADKAVSVFARLRLLGVEETDAKRTMAAFIIGSIVSDGVIDEREYLYMYPALVRCFGEDFNFAEIKNAVENDKKGRKTVIGYIHDMMDIISVADENLQTDIVSVCLLIATVDGKISLKERRYIKKLLKA